MISPAAARLGVLKTTSSPTTYGCARVLTAVSPCSYISHSVSRGAASITTAATSRPRKIRDNKPAASYLSQNRFIRMASNDSLTRDKLFSMEGRVALVTGGGSGIGLMATQALVANGARVYITGRTKEKLDRVASMYSPNIEGEPGAIIPLQCDVTDRSQLADVARQIDEREGDNGLCILVNNAGISGPTQQTEASSAGEMRANLFDDAGADSFDAWTDVYRTNVAQMYFTTMAMLPLLERSTRAHGGWSAAVVNITSISGLVKTAQHHFAYNASKGAANHLTRMLAAEIAEANGIKVRVNAIAPGVFPSEMTTSGSGDDQKSRLEEDKFRGKVPAGRPGREQDMAQAVLFVAANQYLNGVVVPVDGGYTIAAGM